MSPRPFPPGSIEQRLSDLEREVYMKHSERLQFQGEIVDEHVKRIGSINNDQKNFQAVLDGFIETLEVVRDDVAIHDNEIKIHAEAIRKLGG